jgi:hypothetical protein
MNICAVPTLVSVTASLSYTEEKKEHTDGNNKETVNEQTRPWIHPNSQ